MVYQRDSKTDNQQTLFSYDALGRYFCNTLDEAIASGNSKPFDVVVIGAGMYGSYIASKLYYWSKKQFGEAKRLKILVLEAGPYLVHEHIENLPPNTSGIFDQKINKSPYVCDVHRPMGQFSFKFPDDKKVTEHSYCVGGKSLTWGKWSPRLTAEGLTSWPQEVAQYLRDEYGAVENEIGVKPSSDLLFGHLFRCTQILLEEKLKLASLRHLKLQEAPVAVITQNTLAGIYSPDAFSSLGRLLQNVRTESSHPDIGTHPDAKSLFVVPRTLAYKLEIDRGRVSGIHVVSGISQEEKYLKLSDQCDVILAGTAVESTRLVLNSSLPRPANPAEELIGRNLMGHLFSSVSVRIKQKALGGLFKQENLVDLFKQKILKLFKSIEIEQLKPENLDALFKQENLDNLFKQAILKFSSKDFSQPALHHIQGRSEAFGRDYHFQFFFSDLENVFERLYKMFYDQKKVIDESKLRQLEVSKLQQEGQQQDQQEQWITVLVLSCVEVTGDQKAPLYTEGSNWMDLSNQEEKFGEVKYRKPYLRWESSQKDEDFWDEVLSTLFELLSSLADPNDIEYYYPNNPEHDRWKREKPTKFDQYQSTEAFWNSRHESGTLWMGENANESVTDLDGKFHHIQNVYCADQAIFPTVGSANPVLTGLTLDRKIAQAMIDRYKDFPGGFDHKDFPDEFDLESKGFRPLFDGISFNGWGIQSKGEHLLLPNWKILELSTKAGRSHGIAWYKLETFSEFDLIVDWKVFDYYSNSGIIIHAPDPAQFLEDQDSEIYHRGYEIQIDDSGYDYINNIYGSPLHKTGAIYNLAPANRGNVKKPGFWNRFRIISTKSEIKVYLNGKPVSSLSPLPENKNTEGYICLQFHTNKIQFRNILIREH